MLIFCFLTQIRHILARNHVVWRIMRGNWFRGLGCRLLEESGQKKKQSKHLWCAILRIPGKNPWGIVTKFCMLVDIRDVITCATFSDDRLRGLGMARGRISHFPIDLRRRPYSTFTLPCESAKMTVLIENYVSTSSLNKKSIYGTTWTNKLSQLLH